MTPEILLDPDAPFVMKSVPTLFDSPAPKGPDGVPVRQIDRLQTVLGFINENPHLHNQSSWHCETAGCFAGLAVDLSGGQWKVFSSSNWGGKTTSTWVSDYAVVPFLNPKPIANAGVWEDRAARLAMDILGLTENEADILFEGSNTIDDLRDIIDALSDPTKSVDDVDEDDLPYNQEDWSLPEGTRTWQVVDIATGEPVSA